MSEQDKRREGGGGKYTEGEQWSLGERGGKLRVPYGHPTQEGGEGISPRHHGVEREVIRHAFITIFNYKIYNLPGVVY